MALLMHDDLHSVAQALPEGEIEKLAQHILSMASSSRLQRNKLNSWAQRVSQRRQSDGVPGSLATRDQALISNALEVARWRPPIMGSDKERLPAKTSSAHDVDAFLAKLAATPNARRSDQCGRLIFALDATASRQPTWDHAAQIQSEMFVATAALGGLELQLCFYRGFGEFKVSQWLSCSRDLVRLMTSVSCRAGETQIRKVLSHAVNETKRRKVSALVFVGDCMEENVDRLGALAGELGVHGVPAFMFHEGRDQRAAFAFKEIAKLSGGAYCRFDSGSAGALKDLLRAVAVFAAGGREALEDFATRSKGEVLLIARQMEGR
jgi:hypothetical protein